MICSRTVVIVNFAVVVAVRSLLQEMTEMYERKEKD